MDPNACYQRWLDALEEDNNEEAAEAHRDLTAWLASDGLQPNWTGAERMEFHSWRTR